MTDCPGAAAGPRPARWLAGFAVAVVAGHHVGTLVGPAGGLAGGTEWADWVDLITPYAVVGSALGALASARADRRTWLVAAPGTVVYVQGHGVHLAANSIGNARGDARPVHLWDEVVGHYLWYGGLYLMMWALVRVVRPVPGGSWSWPLAALVGLTLATNAIEGATPHLTLAVALAFLAVAVRRRDPRLVLLFAVTVVALAGWGLYWQGFPEFSELGWI
ncbi:MAG: hypothetical protein JWN77_334 [Frankiales bacterium]|nr:hypothetical protein [Frankiales bacterium]